MIKKIMVSFLFASFMLQAAAQGLSQDLPSAQPRPKIVEIYHEQLEGQSLLYQNREYIGFDNRIIGHCFYLSKEFSPASILYDEVLYDNVPLLFDIVKQEVVVRHPNGFSKIKLLNERISWFSFAGHTIIHLKDQASAEGDVPQAGFYDKLYEGELLVLAKKEKSIHSSTNSNELIRRFKESGKYYIKKKGVYHEVSSKRSVLKVMKDQKKELRRLLRKNSIRYRKNKETAIVMMAKYYDSGDQK